MKKTVLRKYARLIAEAGVNVQHGQEVFIVAGLDQPEFVRMVAE
ncbi:MAG: aminopeptidase, partial [Clostridia bacterium]|nr:aminopeptidase [Clostridia bacterium]